ncbi:MAG: ABC transporter permease [Parachlamydiaceae bacterium]|nr:ABC transporter permease [Parachlamydiaceae bacterium]
MRGRVNNILILSFSRWWGILVKEFIQLKRDRLTFAMIVGLPIIQLLLFGYAINTDPKQLPTAIVSGDSSTFTRSFLSAMKYSNYFHFEENYRDEASALRALKKGDIQFIVSIPADFTRKLLREEHPKILVEADATDPIAIGNATAALGNIVSAVIYRDFKGPLQSLITQKSAPYQVVTHKMFNPENITSYNIVPGLMGTILTMTLVMMTAVAITRERERGTMENLLSMPVKSLEVITGKIIPYVVIGLIQATLILIAARLLFNVPFLGNLGLLYAVILLFITGNLMLGITLSSFARSQMQAIQMAVFIQLPSILLSGFMFPFRGMPDWAQFLGNLLPLTYFMRIARGILLKGNGFVDSWPNIWPLLVFSIVMMIIGVKCYHKTLD